MSNERAAFSSARATLGTLLLADGRIMLTSSSVLAQVHGSQRSQFQDASHGALSLAAVAAPGPPGQAESGAGPGERPGFRGGRRRRRDRPTRAGAPASASSGVADGATGHVAKTGLFYPKAGLSTPRPPPTRGR